MRSAGTDVELIGSLRAQVIACFRDLIGDGARVALVDYPYNTNCGDSAIWAGEIAVLRELEATIVYVCETGSYNRARMADVLTPDTVILLHGGGNFGDLWPGHQNLRDAVVTDFPDHRIVQLPQSMAFRNERSLDAIRATMGAHRRLTMLVRDRASLQVARERVGLDTVLCPDAAFGLGPVQRSCEPERDVLVLARTDHEGTSGLSSIDLPGSVVADWTQTAWQARRWRSKKIIPRLAKHTSGSPGLHRVVAPLRDRCLTAASEQLVTEAFRQLSMYRVVVTDRLHAHVLCVLTGVPHVVLDNATGKIFELHAAWTSDSASTRTCSSLDEAREAALAMLADVRR